MEIGDKTHQLTLTVFTGKNRHRHPLGLFQCDCGNITTAEIGKVKSGHTKSCGCRNRKIGKGRKDPFELVAARRVWRNYKCNAKTRNLIFELSFEDFVVIIQQNCFYCDSPPSQKLHWWSKNHPKDQYLYNGIDRQDNATGYTKGNVVPCCGTCNMAKAQMTVDEFIDHAKKIVGHFHSQQALCY